MVPRLRAKIVEVRLGYVMVRRKRDSETVYLAERRFRIFLDCSRVGDDSRGITLFERKPGNPGRCFCRINAAEHSIAPATPFVDSFE
jgi:hypothetical protein